MDMDDDGEDRGVRELDGFLAGLVRRGLGGAGPVASETYGAPGARAPRNPNETCAVRLLWRCWWRGGADDTRARRGCARTPRRYVEGRRWEACASRFLRGLIGFLSAPPTYALGLGAG